MRLKAASPLSRAPSDTDGEATCRLAVVGVTTEIGIGISNEEVRRVNMRIDQFHVNGTPEIAKNVLSGQSMFHTGVFNEVADNAHDIWASSNG